MDLCTAGARALPAFARARLGAALGDLLRRVDRRHARVARENMRLVFGDRRSAAEIDALVAACFRHFSTAALDVFALDDTAEDAVRTFPLDGVEHADAALARGRGLLFFSGHFGMWELAALAGGLRFPVALVARPIDNPLLEARLARIRARWGNDVIAKRGAVGEVLRRLRRGGAVAMLIDQRPKHIGLVMPFLGRDAHVRPTLAVLALRTGAPIVPVRCRREPDGRWRVRFEPEVPVVRSGDDEADARAVMGACNARLERWILESPEQWLWTHARWKEPRAHARHLARPGSATMSAP
jgi:KDO2-lipid IV(A) lauroyltransferase